ncbi:MAG: mannosyltransferase family protein [Opitutaceae bacterium]|nr:mannosyltransferase family protein [Opitutaceae bacterium]
MTDRHLLAQVSPTFLDVSLRTPYFRILLLFLLSRLFVAGCAFVSRGVIEPSKFFGPPNHWLDYVTRWDASWYISIVVDGYQHQPGTQSNVAFFPLYPLIVKAFAWAGDVRIVGMVVSNLCLLLASFVLWALFARRDAGIREPDTKDSVPDIAVALFLFNPVTLFFSIMYTESLFFLLTTSTVLAAQTGRWGLAFAAAFAAGTTRSTGLLLALPLFVEYYRVSLHPFRWERRIDLRGLFLSSAPALGVLAFALHLAARFGDPLLFSSVQRTWKRALVWPWQTLTPEYLRVYAPFYLGWFLFFLAVGVLLIGRGMLTRIRWSYSVLGIAMILLYLSSGRLESIPRYLSVVFPLYLVAAEFWRDRPEFRPAIACVGGIAGFLSVTLFINGYWFT